MKQTCLRYNLFNQHNNQVTTNENASHLHLTRASTKLIYSILAYILSLPSYLAPIFIITYYQHSYHITLSYTYNHNMWKWYYVKSSSTFSLLDTYFQGSLHNIKRQTRQCKTIYLSIIPTCPILTPRPDISKLFVIMHAYRTASNKPRVNKNCIGML